MDNVNLSSEALLSNHGDMTSFRYGNSNIRFRTPKCLKRYTEVKEWDNGYIVVMADYEGMGETEEYIELLHIFKTSKVLETKQKINGASLCLNITTL